MFGSSNRLRIAILIGAFIIAPYTARGSTVLPMTIQELADAAGQAIDAVVESTDSAWSADHTTIRTTVRFRDVRYLKGRLADSTDTFELVVPGGTVGDAQLILTGAPLFKVGQRWLLFLHPTYNVHPVVGIFRGAFRIDERPTGEARVLDSAGLTVVGIDERGLIRVAPPASTSAQRAARIVGAASDSVVGVYERTAPPVVPMGYDRFLEQLAPVLLNSKDHGLTAPAGRPTGLRARAVPFQLRGRVHADQDSVNFKGARSGGRPVTVERGRHRDQ